MTASVYRVLVNGETMGFHAYQNAADVWFGVTGLTEADARKAIGNRCTCEDYPTQKAVLTSSRPGEPDVDSETYELRWCESCDAVATPPFDGYAYHDYECAWRGDGDRCTCGG